MTESQRINFKRVDAERYDEMLNILPPAVWLTKGFLVGEAWNHRKCTVTGRVRPTFKPFLVANHAHWEGDAGMTESEFRAFIPPRFAVDPWSATLSNADAEA